MTYIIFIYIKINLYIVLLLYLDWHNNDYNDYNISNIVVVVDSLGVIVDSLGVVDSVNGVVDRR